MSATNFARLPLVAVRCIASFACGLLFTASAWAQAPAQPSGTVPQQQSQVRALADSRVALQNGAFTSVVAIDVPSFRSITPALKLVYSSSAGNGFAGVGWELSGFSTIERVSPGRGSPRYGLGWSSDRYTLDGEELIPSLALGGTHATLRQSFLRIVGRAPNEGNTWTVTRPDGTVMSYTPVFQTDAGTFRWGLTKTQDTHGNVVNYGWTCDKDGAGATLDCYPASVSYANVVITLTPEARTDRETFATGRRVGSRNWRLAWITIDVAGNRRNSYFLRYTNSVRTGRSLLKEVRPLGRDAVTALPSTSATYSEAASGFGAGTNVGYSYGLSTHIWYYSQVYTD
ncbi:MAG: SpvB/TcaC N-terminal domain-containing protein, partial [Lysobacter sp.]